MIATLNLDHAVQMNDASAKAIALTGTLNNYGARQKYTAFDFLLTRSNSDAKAYGDASQGFAHDAQSIREIFTASEPDLLPYLAAYSDLHDQWQADIGDPAFHQGADPQWHGGADLLQSATAQRLSTQSRTAGSALIKNTQAWADHWSVVNQQQRAFLKTAIVASVLTSVGAAAAIAIILSRSIAAPLVTIAAAMRRLAAGDRDVSVPAMGRRDEIGELAQAVEIFKAAAIDKERAESQVDAQRTQAESERRLNEDARARAAHEQAQVVSSIGAGLEKLSSGDLTFRINETFAPDYERLRVDFNAAMTQLQATMTTLVGSTHSLRSGGAEITQASDDLSRRTEQQAASLEETAAALDQITATVKKTAEGALEACKVVATAKTDAERSGLVVREAVATMTRIEESSRQISQIIGVIDEIAFQTNLLALNAGVEAARAGDAGRGFAVVASEVRALAQRSAEAAKEIKTLISASTDQVAQGVDRVGQTGKALTQIVVQVSQINDIVTEITASAQEQAAGLRQVNTAVNQMDQVTQQNAAMVEQATAAAHSMQSETNALSDLVAQFRVGETHVEAPRAAPARRASPAPAASRTTPSFSGGARRRGGAALATAPAAAADAEGWEEF
jgi:methyl-accepting chemotaxis protein